ncbi:MAG TPA: hypothetical protein DEQ02_00020 [Ruminococcaceae bacterium]|nr:hypothetical protein [Oscillospiraceae bacterium]
MPKTEAQIRATRKYDAKMYDRINLLIPKGKKEIIKAFTAKTGESLNGFISRAIDEAMDRDAEE